ncbi:MAG: hypothetical protein V1772_08750 [Chloroflexota bacterium]
MLNEDGTIDFVPELAAILDAFLADYEARKSPLSSDLERGLVIAYALGVLCCNIEGLWDYVGALPQFGALQPRALFQACSVPDEATRRESLGRVAAELARHNWLGLACH